MITATSYAYSIALVCALRLFTDCTATEAPPAPKAYPTASSSSSDWELRMIVNSVHPLTNNNLVNAEVLNEPVQSDSYYNGPNHNFSDEFNKGSGGLGQYGNQSYLSQVSGAYKTNHVIPASLNSIMSRINVRPLQNEVAKPTVFNTQYFNTFREIKTTVMSVFQKVQEFVSYMFTFFTTGKLRTLKGRMLVIWLIAYCSLHSVR